MNKRVLVLFFVLFLGLANADPVLDQSNVSTPTFVYTTALGNNSEIAQSFKPSITEEISFVRFPMAYSAHFYPPETPLNEIILEIQTDQAGNPSGQLVDPSCIATIPSFTEPAFVQGQGVYAWFDFIIGDNCFLNENTTYWMVLSSPETASTKAYVVYASPDSGYPNGTHLSSFDGVIWTRYFGVFDLLFMEYAGPSIACSNNIACGVDSWVDGSVCQEGNVYQNYRVYTCSNPGTGNSFCTESESLSLKQICENPTPYCSDGACTPTEPLDHRVSVLEQQVQDLTNQNNALTERVDGLEIKDQEQDTRMTTIETTLTTINNLVSQLQISLDSFIDKITLYLTGLDFNMKKDMLCTYMEDKKLTNYSDLGIRCGIIENTCVCKKEFPEEKAMA